MAKQSNTMTEVTSFTHKEAKRKNIPTQEMQSIMTEKDKQPVRVAYEKRNPDLDPQLIWRGKYDGDDQLEVTAPPLFVQEKIKPQTLIDDLRKTTKESSAKEDTTPDLFADFNGLPSEDAKTEFYQHDCNWQNRMILGDSLYVMASLAEKEGLQGQVQCIYLDPPYGIKFNSNFQWSTTTTNVKDGKDITREPEMVKAFRDTWRDGIHTYLSYLRDRLIVARSLLSGSGSIFVQIGDENVHRVRALMDEIFGEDNFISIIIYKKGGTATSSQISNICDFILWYSKDKKYTKFRGLYDLKKVGEGESTGERYDQIEDPTGIIRRPMTLEEKKNPSLLPENWKPYKLSNPCSQHDNPSHRLVPLSFQGKNFFPPADRQWSVPIDKMYRLIKTNRLVSTGKNLAYIMFVDDFPVMPVNNIWLDFLQRTSKIYIVQTAVKVIERCILMATDPGDLVLDPTCGSGTTAYVAEQWGRRWITIDTSRVALALARARIMGAKYPYYLLADSKEGHLKEAEITHTTPKTTPTTGNIRHGFVYERVPHITLKSIANNVEIDVIYDKFQQKMEPLRAEINALTGNSFEEWKLPRQPDKSWKSKAITDLIEWWNLRVQRQKEIDASIAAKADFEYLYDRPYVDNKKVRVAGPFTVESLSPHRYIPVDEDDNPVLYDKSDEGNEAGKFVNMILETLKVSGIQQAHKDDKIDFLSVSPWPGTYICAEGRYEEGKTERRAAIFIGPEFGTVSRPDLVSAVREAADADFDVLVACAFNFDAPSSEFNKLGKIPVLKARMNADLHMAGELKNTGNGNLFVVFGEPDIEIIDAGNNQIQVKLKGVDVFRPNEGIVESSDPDEIACWFVDTDYNEESFFVRQAYFLGANDPYAALKKSLKAEINRDAWESLHSDLSRPFNKPSSGRIAVKVINHLGDEVLKIFKVK